MNGTILHNIYYDHRIFKIGKMLVQIKEYSTTNTTERLYYLLYLRESSAPSNLMCTKVLDL